MNSIAVRSHYVTSHGAMIAQKQQNSIASQSLPVIDRRVLRHCDVLTELQVDGVEIRIQQIVVDGSGRRKTNAIAGNGD